MSIFKNKEVLDINYIPSDDLLLFREKEMEKIRIVFNSIKSVPSHLVCYGFAGTGKTMLVKFMSKKHGFQKFNEKIVYINTADCPTELQSMSYLMGELGHPIGGKIIMKYYQSLKKILKDYDLHILLILDEVDKLLYRSGDNFIYNLLETGRVSIIMITNNVMCFDRIEDRVKSRLGGMPRLLFEPYDANQLRDILEKRSGMAFDPSKITSSVISRIAAIAAQEHGDARRAIGLLKACGEIADARKTEVKQEYIDEADDMTESSEISNIMESLPLQAKAVLTSVYTCISDNKTPEVTSTDLYDEYTKTANRYNLKIMTDRRIRDYLWELEGSGLVISRMTSMGRHVREKKIKLGVPARMIEPIIKKMWKGR